jgi:hypothetical protein
MTIFESQIKMIMPNTVIEMHDGVLQFKSSFLKVVIFILYVLDCSPLHWKMSN